MVLLNKLLRGVVLVFFFFLAALYLPLRMLVVKISEKRQSQLGTYFEGQMENKVTQSKKGTLKLGECL